MLLPWPQVRSSSQLNWAEPLPFHWRRASANKKTLSEIKATSVLRFCAARAAKKV